MGKKIVSQGKHKNVAEVSMRAKVTELFVLNILCIFPLIYGNYYFNIIKVKYYYFWINAVIMISIMFVLLLYYKIEKSEQTNIRMHIKSWQICSLLVFLLVAICSTIFSDYKSEAFLGNEGRYSGLFLLLLYGISFFLVSQYLEFKRWYLDAFLITGMLVCLFGITDYFNMDLLGFKVNMSERQKPIFTSTIGNINTYTAYVSLVMGVAVTMFAICKEHKRMICYYIAMFISFTAIIMGVSDNAYLAIGALFAFLPFYLFQTKEGVRRYLVIIATFFSVIQFIDIINTKIPERVVGIDSLFLLVSKYNKLHYIVICLWLVVGMFYLVKYKRKNAEKSMGKILVRCWTAVVTIIFVAVLFMLWDANIGGHASRYGAFQGYLVLNDDWGTHRGYIWKLGIESYKDFPLIQKIFGCGPDTYGIVMKKNYQQEMASRYNEVFDSAHNEYLQYFVTIGPIGLIAYISFLVSSGAGMVKKAVDKPYVMAVLFATICYGAQAFVNINLPIATPIMWTLLMVGAAGCRERIEA